MSEQAHWCKTGGPQRGNGEIRQLWYSWGGKERETEASKVRSGRESENKAEEKPEPRVALVRT